jgi:tRNA G10  N-methylase Trm11
MASLGIHGVIHEWDACDLPIEDNTVDRIVTNLPWGHQAPVRGRIDAILHEISRVLKPEGIAVLLSNGTEYPLLPNRSPDETLPIRMAGTTATLVRYR